MSERRLTPREIQSLQEAITADYEAVNLRLREGEYQYVLAKAIASFQLELYFPNVKEIIGRLYGGQRTQDVDFIRKIQTILKKMEKSNVVRILPKKRPWELQTYGLSSFRFRDVNNNSIIVATDQEIEHVQEMLDSMQSEGESAAEQENIGKKVFILALIVVTSYAAVLWDLMQPIIDPIIFVSAFSIAVAFSLMLGKTLSKKQL